MTIRSADGGARFDPGSLNVVFDLGTSAEEILRTGGHNYDGEPPLNFLDRNVIVMSGAMPALLKPDSRAWLRASADGGRTWRRTILLPLDGLSSLTGHGPPTVRADGVAILGLATTSADGWTNRPLVYASTDGARWNFLSFITPQIEGGSAVSDRGELPLFGAIRHFYARASWRCATGASSPRCAFSATARDLLDGHLRKRGRGADLALPVARQRLGRAGRHRRDGGRPHRLRLRLSPRALRHPRRVSEDGGRSWGSELVLRDDGGSWDLGYPRVIEAAPGRLLTVYYFNRKDDPIQLNGGVRHIARTLFSPD